MAEVRVLPELFMPKVCRQPRSRLATRPHARPFTCPLPEQTVNDVKIQLNSASTRAYSPDNGMKSGDYENHRIFDGFAHSIKSQESEMNHSDSKSNDLSGSLPCTPQHGEPSSNWMAFGRVVWAKLLDERWWPAEVLEERESQSSISENDVSGCVLIQFYETRQRDLVDPSTSLSPFDHCFEERSSQPDEAFQSALKHALQRSEELKLLNNGADMKKRTPEPRKTPDHWNRSSSSRTQEDGTENGRGKRKRKPKIHFDERNHQTNVKEKIKEDRRLRIMRFLGLAAPIGSPFSRV